MAGGARRLYGTSLRFSSRASSNRSSPTGLCAPLGALGALLTYGTLAEVGTTLGPQPRRLLRRPYPALHPPTRAAGAAVREHRSRCLAAWLRAGSARSPPRRAPSPKPRSNGSSPKDRSRVARPEPAEMIRNVLELKDLHRPRRDGPAHQVSRHRDRHAARRGPALRRERRPLALPGLPRADRQHRRPALRERPLPLVEDDKLEDDAARRSDSRSR